MKSYTKTLIVLFLAVQLGSYHSAHAQTTQNACTFTLLADQSLVTLTGKVTRPISSDMKPADPTAVTGLEGTLTLAGPCPADAASLQPLLASAASFSGSLTFYPTSYTLQAGSFAKVEWKDISFNTVIGVPAIPGTATSISMTIDGGYALSTSILSSTPDRVELVGVGGQGQTTPSGVLEGPNLKLTLSAFTISMQSSYTASVGGISGATDYTLQGTIVATAPAGQGAVNTPAPVVAPVPVPVVYPQVPVPTTPAPVVAPIAPVPVPIATAPAPVAVVPAPVPAPVVVEPPIQAPATSTPSNPQECIERSSWNPTTSECECDPEFTGAACNGCLVDSACSTFYPNEETTCGRDQIYSINTAFKSYVCDLKGSGLQDILEAGSFYVACNTSAPEINPTSGVQSITSTGVSDDGPYCDVGFALKDNGSNPVSCKAKMCNFSPDSSLVSCRTTSCSCKTECPDIQSILNSIEGNPATLDCDSNGVCSFDIKDFYIKLTAPCTTHECKIDGYTLSKEIYAITEEKSYDPIIAAIPLMAVTAVVTILSIYLLAHKTYFNSMYTSTGHLKDGAAGGGALDPSYRLRPHTPVQQLRFTKLKCLVPLQGGWFGGRGRKNGDSDGEDTKVVLAGVSGAAVAGELVGIIGPSGSGKTTLLALLAGSKDDRGPIVSGSVTLDGEPVKTGRVAYCAQDSTLLPTLTVEECLRYSALLRMPKDKAPDQIQHAVHSVIEELGLSHVASSRVGSSTGGKRGVSGGERRRVSIGMELVINPAVLLLDEPSSGLDSHTAYNLMVTLKQVASSGRIVVLSFHQPSPAMFNTLDRVFLMAQGHCVFSGAPAAAEPYLAKIGLPCPAGTAVAEHLLYCACDTSTLPTLLKQAAQNESQMTDDLQKSPTLGAKNNNTTHDVYSNKGALGGDDVEKTTITTSDELHASSSSHSNSRGCGWSREFAVLFWRTLVDITRNPSLLFLHWGTALLMGLFVGCIFWQVGLDISGAQNRAGGLFFSLALFAFTSLASMDLLVAERHMVRREVSGGYYHPISYLISKAVLDGLLLRVLPVFLYSAAFYPMMGLQTGATNVALFLMTLATFALTAGALSLAVAIGCGTAGKASLVMNLTLLISLLEAGFFVNVQSIPDWIQWLHYLSIFYYGFAILTTNEMQNLLLNFTVDGYAAVSNVRGLTFLKIIGVDPGDMTTNIIVLDCMYAIFVLLAIALLYLRVSRKGHG